MNNPQRHDIFEDENGTRVAVRQVFPPNAVGVTYVEYKNLIDSNLRFLPQADFLEQYKWVDNFDSIDTHAKVSTQNPAEATKNPAETQKASPEGSEEAVSEVADEPIGQKAEETRTAKPSTSQ
jgi:hypothetical protein